MIKYEPVKVEPKWPFDKAQGKQEYDHTVIESYWQSAWGQTGIYEPDLDKSQKPFYNLMMFPYPSAEGLHVGNMYAFCGSDIYGRYKRMQGFDVFEPIGLDGFGIHSENYAIKVGRHPKEQVKISEKNFYRQLRVIGNGFDWSRKLETYDPNYYKWTQWIFIQLFKKGLAYRKSAPVNFCPSCKTVLADEQVVGVGVCERCETPVEKRELEQWFFRITDYADRLLESLECIDWSEKVKIAQRNWIGKSQGVEILFPCDIEADTSVLVFTTRPDTIFGVTFMALAPEHPLVTKIIGESKSKIGQRIRQYVANSLKNTEVQGPDIERVKTGVATGFFCINPLSKKRIPIYIADYVLTTYGTGAVMGVPAHDQRDWDFAKKCHLDIVQVIEGGDISQAAYTGEGRLIDSGKFTGMDSNTAIKTVTKYIKEEHLGSEKITWHLRDWIISRQRYWGPPIPVIYCVNCWKVKSEKLKVKSVEGKNFAIFGGQKHAIVPVPEEDLPVKLPYIENFKPTGTGVSPLAQDPSFVEVKCPQCGGQAQRETDVSDTFLDSSWYFLRYLATDCDWAPFPSEAFVKNTKSQALNSKQIQNQKIQNSKKFRISDLEIRNSLAWRGQWLPVDMYIGGAEHAVLHLLYTRFLTMVFNDLGLLKFEEPFTKFRAHGLLISGGVKMSKSRGNVVMPDAYIAKYGTDTLRCYLMFCGRFTQGGDFQDTGIEGMHRFLKRVWRLVVNAGPVGSSSRSTSSAKSKSVRNQNDSVGLRALSGTPSAAATRLSEESRHLMHKTIKKVTEDIESLDYNTAISALMIWLNFLEEKVVNSSQLTDRAKSLQFTVHSSQTEQTAATVNREPGTENQLSVNREPITVNELETFLKLLAPFAPHMTEELWQLVHSSQFTVDSRTKSVNREPKAKRTDNWSVHLQPWPKYDPKLAQAKMITLVVQVNGKLRDRLPVEAGISQKDAEQLALNSPRVQKYLEKKKPQKIIFVADRLINLVV